MLRKDRVSACIMSLTVVLGLVCSAAWACFTSFVSRIELEVLSTVSASAQHNFSMTMTVCNVLCRGWSATEPGPVLMSSSALSWRC